MKVVYCLLVGDLRMNDNTLASILIKAKHQLKIDTLDPSAI